MRNVWQQIVLRRGEAVRPEFCGDRKSTRLNSSHGSMSDAVFCLKKKKKLHHCRADSRQLAAVWPQPQMEASRMAWAISRIMSISLAVEPSGLAFVFC